MKVKQIIILILFLILKLNSFSQLIVPEEDTIKYIIGFHTAGQITFGNDALGNKFHDIALETEPYIAYFPVKKTWFWTYG